MSRWTCTDPMQHRTAWRVMQRNSRHSAFDGGRRRWSRYSTVRCLRCHRAWRTKARYVATLNDDDDKS